MILGVDPGLNGALVLLHEGEVEIVHDMPTVEIERNRRTKREINLAALAHLIPWHRLKHAWVEKVGAMPGQGVSSMFSFGRSTGMIEGMLAANHIPTSYVVPPVWKKRLMVPSGKDGARLRASQLFPQAADNWPLKKHDGRAEAALIALYGFLHDGGERT